MRDVVLMNIKKISEIKFRGLTFDANSTDEDRGLIISYNQEKPSVGSRSALDFGQNLTGFL